MNPTLKHTHVNVQQAHALLKSTPEMVVLDLRTADEFEMFYIEGAVNLDCKSDFFERRVNSLDKDTLYLIHCHSGGRSIKTLELFSKYNFKNITHMDGGLREWMHADLPLINNWSI